MENKVIKKKRMSLKWKWAIGTGVGVLLIFALFSFFVFKIVTDSLYAEEHRDVESTVTQVRSRLQNANEINYKTTDIFRPDLNQKSAVNNNQGGFNDSLLASLTRRDLVVSVYNLEKESVFSNQRISMKTSLSERKSIKRSKFHHKDIIVGQAPIINKDNQVIGYVRVVDLLVKYNNRYQRLIWLFTLTSLLIFMVISIFGYGLTAYLLKPMNLINQSMRNLEEDPQTDLRVPEIDTNDELSDLAHEFNDMIDRMQRYIDQQRQFVEDVSHELRTPVAVVEGHLKMLDRWGKDDPQVLDESIKASLEETQRMKSLVSEMLELTRADQIEINYADEKTNVVQLVNQVFNDFKMIHPEFNFVMDDDITGEPIVPIYRNHLEQILVILLDNAIKYSKDRKEIHISTANTKKTVEIAVQDFGEGIAEENLKQVFNRFYRIDKARSRDQGGNGLGLSIAKKLTEEYHGNISLESSVGSGSIFRIKLPIIEDQQIEISEK
ncbi:HAMP domain-containing sensor histidine kinase [Pediococcus pentosaceus]|uniref:HAMP domain-containing sensor histidine kinase n=1 Tax=Pediococcus pentosaceus TaxID=1255 RepID=UPI00223AAF09|nr:HAMP domain-containing histidine kinase [Pediococcus pentosaceus]MCT1175922.1 sensor histidine kinase [Pediococcus pentosaceus]